MIWLPQLQQLPLCRQQSEQPLLQQQLVMMNSLILCH
jgi:hypothetical protein